MDAQLTSIVHAELEGIPTEHHERVLALANAVANAVANSPQKEAKLTPFTKMTWSEMKSAEGLHLDVRNVELATRRAVTSLSLPPFLDSVQPTEHLKGQLARLERTWSRNSEAGRRTFVDALLAEAVDTFYHGILVDERSSESMLDSVDVEPPESGSTAPLRVFSEVEIKWSGACKGVTGNVDYLFGHADADDVEEGMKDSFLIAVEAKKEWPDSAVRQAIAEGGVLLRYRQKNNKTGPVFVVLTNATFWVFYCIDNNGVVYSSGPEIVFGETTLPMILRWLRWFVMAAAVTSPRASTVDMTDEEKTRVQSSLTEYCVKLWEKRSRK
ncbi:uncharacterized protein EV422DRAFT_523234 [Fimicolochytrium jonesii]|uniref:uncharacterized protein n=1 Tax=Fimicolochytrium jonesii TaxID=1396493 RepID=UPI0022FE110F|nr:uncharacterized protein EV422DRAFT_523234 [Fimicolochytrium jonesii]KAI8823070.1 hypothetical protein EV422DRAFT_523234 [Fimicolochytrium jonesii]